MIFLVAAQARVALEKRPLASEPVMGVTTRAAFGTSVTENDVFMTADLLESTGLLAAGYKYLMLDDGATLADRDEKGRLALDLKRFPAGLKRIADYVHEKGLFFGVYAAAGTATCAGGAGSIGSE